MRKHDMIMRLALVEGSRNFEGLVFFNMQLNLTTRASSPYRNATASAKIEPVSLGSAAGHHNHCTTTAASHKFLEYKVSSTYDQVDCFVVFSGRLSVNFRYY